MGKKADYSLMWAGIKYLNIALPNSAHTNPALATPRLRIALLGYRSHPHVGGQGIYLHYLSKALAEQGHEVAVYSGPPYPQLVDDVQLVKVPSLDLYAHPRPLRALKLKNLASFTDVYEWLSKLSGGFAEPYTFGRRLLKYHARELKTFDIVHDNQSLCSGLLDLQKAGCKVVATIHHPIHMDRQLALDSALNSGHRSLVRRWYRFIHMQEKVVRELKHLVTVSQQSQRDIEKHFSLVVDNIAVIPNGIDTRIFKPLPAIAKIPARLISTASSDQTLKGLHILLRAFVQIQQSLPEAELVIVGKLKTRSLAHNILEAMNENVRARIKFISNLGTEELVEQYASASVAVCPSLYEGFGMPALEAMACGLPLVCSDGGALPEVVAEAAMLVPAGKVDELAKACLSVLQDSSLQTKLSARALTRVNNSFCWQTVAQSYLDFYQTVLAERAYTEIKIPAV